MDLFFIATTFIKRDGIGDDISFQFCQKESFLEKVLNVFIDIICPDLYLTFDLDWSKEFSVKSSIEQTVHFKNFRIVATLWTFNFGNLLVLSVCMASRNPILVTPTTLLGSCSKCHRCLMVCASGISATNGSKTPVFDITIICKSTNNQLVRLWLLKIFDTMPTSLEK